MATTLRMPYNHELWRVEGTTTSNGGNGRRRLSRWHPPNIIMREWNPSTERIPSHGGLEIHRVEGVQQTTRFFLLRLPRRTTKTTARVRFEWFMGSFIMRGNKESLSFLCCFFSEVSTSLMATAGWTKSGRECSSVIVVAHGCVYVEAVRRETKGGRKVQLWSLSTEWPLPGNKTPPSLLISTRNGNGFSK